MKKKIIPFLIAVLLYIPAAVHAEGTRKGGGSPIYSLDGDAAPIPFEVNMGSQAAKAFPWNSLTADQKSYLRALLIQNPNANALYVSTMSNFVPGTNAAFLVPGSTGSFTFNSNADLYGRYGAGVSSDTVHGVMTRTNAW